MGRWGRRERRRREGHRRSGAVGVEDGRHGLTAIVLFVITESNRKFAHYGRNLWNLLGLTTCECSSGYILALHMKVGIEKHVYSLCSSIVLGTPDFGYMFRKLGHMVQSVGIHRGLCSGDYSIAYIEHNP
jgi:hypothetical protein